MAVNQLENTADIIDFALNLSGEKTDGTSEYESEAIGHLNAIYRALVDGGSSLMPGLNEDWLWLRKSPPGVLMLQPKIDATASVTTNAQGITFSTAPSASVDSTVTGWFFKVDGETDIYRIATHSASATAASLDAIWSGETDTAAAVTLFKLEYDLPSDFLRPSGPLRVQRNAQDEIEIGSIEALDRDYPLRTVNAGTPTNAGLVDSNTIRFNRYSESDLIRVEVPYLMDPPSLSNATSSTPLVPKHHYITLAYLLAHQICLLKPDDRAEKYAGLARAGLESMRSANVERQKSAQRQMGRLIPRRDRMYQTRRPLINKDGLVVD